MLDQLQNHQKSEKKQASNLESKSDSLKPLKAEDVICIDDKAMFENEQLSNLNRYYFIPFLDDSIPYKETSRAAVDTRKQCFKQLI